MVKFIKLMIITFLLASLVGCDVEDTIDTNINNHVPNISSDASENTELINSGETNVGVNSGEILESGEKDKQDVINEESGEGEEVDVIVEVVPASTANLSNTTYAWGFRRMQDFVRPEFTASYTKVLDDYEGIYAGNSEDKSIYLTFDEGYENGYTGAILDTLKEKEVTAVFFVTMPYVKQNPDLVQRMIDEGHIVGNHTVNHPSMPSVTDDAKLEDEIIKLHDYVKENFGGYEMTYLRPPKGEYSERTVKLSKDLGYKTVLWSSAYDDWDVNKQDRLDYARKMILNYVHNGCVMLLHAVSKDNTALLGEAIDSLRASGYEFKSLDEFKY